MNYNNVNFVYCDASEQEQNNKKSGLQMVKISCLTDDGISNKNWFYSGTDCKKALMMFIWFELRKNYNYSLPLEILGIWESGTKANVYYYEDFCTVYQATITNIN